MLIVILFLIMVAQFNRIAELNKRFNEFLRVSSESMIETSIILDSLLEAMSPEMVKKLNGIFKKNRQKEKDKV